MGETTDGSELSRDLLLGKLALEKGWITAAQFRTVVSEVSSGRAVSLPQYLVAHGYLPPDRVAELLRILGKAAAPAYPPFGKFSIQRELGRGAMGVVYEAEDPQGTRVALKLLIEAANRHPDEARVDRERFLREAEVLRRLPEHPGLVRILEAGVAEDRRYLAMELVDGLPFHAWRRRGSLNVRQQVAVLRDAALAVHHVHENGIIHRDLKPENILVDREHRPRITDFGLAKAAGGSGEPSLTASGSTLGTPAYMSPEQVQGLKTVDRRADVYALGVMLYELLTGRRPFEGASPYEIMMKTVNEPVVPPSKVSNLLLNPVLYQNLENICLVALAKDPDQRYPDAAAFARDLTRWLRGEEFKLVVPRAWRLWRSKRNLPRLALLASMLLASAAGGLWWDARRRREDWGPLLPAAKVEAAKLQPGAVLEYYAGLNRNALAFRKPDRRERFDDPAKPAWAAHHGYWTSRRWTGYLQVPRSGPYVFALSNGEFARVTLGGRDLASGDSALPVSRTLEAGLHAIVIDHAHKGPDDTIKLSWNRQGEPALLPIGPAALLHDPAGLVLVDAPSDRPVPVAFVPGAEEGESLKILDDSGRKASIQKYETGHPFWKGARSGHGHLAWGSGVRPGDRLKVRFSAGEDGPATLVLGLTLASDHGVFRVLVNDREIARELDLFHDTDMKVESREYRDVSLHRGANTLEFIAVGSPPGAREWGGGSGLHKLGLDYVLVR